jgi:hypothetical protein
MKMQCDQRGRKSVRKCVLASAAVSAWVATAYAVVPPPPVVQNNWVGPVNPSTGEFVIPANWSLNLAPSTTDNHFATINNDGIAVISGDAQAAFLNLGMTYRGPGDVDKGTLNITGGTISLGEFRVGGRESLTSLTATVDDYNDGGIGSVLQTGGTVNVNYSHERNPGDPLPGPNTSPPASGHYEPPIQSFYVGDSGNDKKGAAAVNHAEGTYRITGGSLLSGLYNNDSITIGTGVGTKGTFIQEGGSVTSTGFVTVGRRGATATYTMSGGTLTQQGNTGLIIGDGETVDAVNLAAANGTFTSGTFTQSGGDVSVVGAEIGRRSGVGVYNMSGGTLGVAGGLSVGAVATTAAGLLNANGTLNLTPNQNGKPDGVITVGTNLNVALGSSTTSTNGVGTINMSTGSILFSATAPIFAVGNGLGVSATVNQSGGTVDMNRAVNTGTSNLSIGRGNSAGVYNLSGTGVLKAKTITMESGATSGTPVRQLNVSGGTLTADTVNFGNGSTTSVRSFNVSGGNVTLGSLTTGQSATTYVSGGTFDITTSLALTTNGTFRTAVPLKLAPAVTLGTAGNATVQVDASTLEFSGTFASSGATLVKTGAGTLTISGVQTNTSNATITNSAGGGVVNLNSDGGTNLTVNASSGTTNFGATQHLKKLTVAAAAKVTAGGAKDLVVPALTISGSGRLDLTNNRLIVDAASTSAATIRGYLVSAYDAGRWDLNGLTSSTAAANPGGGTGLGYLESGGQVAVRYTWVGDLNLDGFVDSTDAAIMAGGDGTTWAAGDLDYDGVKSADDFALFDLGVAVSGGANISAVPEPGMVLPLVALAGLGRRRCRRVG